MCCPICTSPTTIAIASRPAILLEGILIFADAELHERMEIKLFDEISLHMHLA